MRLSKLAAPYEVVVIPNPSGSYRMNVADIAATARGGEVFLGNQAPQMESLTESLRAGGSEFEFSFDSPTVAGEESIASIASLPSGVGLMFNVLAAGASGSVGGTSGSAAQSLTTFSLSQSLGKSAGGSDAPGWRLVAADVRACCERSRRIRCAGRNAQRVIRNMLSGDRNGASGTQADATPGSVSSTLDRLTERSPFRPLWRAMRNLLETMMKSPAAKLPGPPAAHSQPEGTRAWEL